jgi:hypothetical protein
MARKLKGGAIQSGTINVTQLSTTVVTNITQGGGPKVTAITYPNSANAASNSGNESIVLTGTGFEPGVQIYINGNAVPAVSRTNANSVSFTTPALGTGATYVVYVVNPDGGTAIFVPGMQVSAGPVWVTTSPLSSWGASQALSRNLVATSDSAVSYSLAVGSSLPGGLSLASNGLLSGTLSSQPGSETTYNFTAVATDAELQTSSKAFSINATVGITATGGTVSNISGYRVHTFTSSGSFTVTGGVGTVEYLVVAGGGGSGYGNGFCGGGGGAGGYRIGSGLAVTAGTSYDVTVGAGGAGGTYDRGSAAGSPSTFSSITSAGGGQGGQGGAAGGNGGSGGGAGGFPNTGRAAGAGNTPSTSPSQGNNGGSPGSSLGGGGGGAGSAGNPSGLNGGSAAASTISGSTVYYAGGGGGSPNGLGGGTATSSEKGGGGDGGGAGPVGGVAGSPNTGGGAGGAGGFAPDGAGAFAGHKSGGSGIVIIRYAA